ncbi:lipoprotein LipL31 [Leptospira wolffii]|uniref:Lipoprotein LipL31 n=1 Tax=Leptospira wolffii TaxID=409998 RepID=A0ABV5BM85_9LEPT|nr:lipoprotein LipL31 [Leptospira wolffii]TGK56968.1 lipoprotein LipL31 [Leptospira wolffii]TGK71001.1 lipoprotein LipL31 [Leptospira wolffii]TGK75692.1 lipoprotein LipL31 [Leptospira wolffii]TGL32740.1 lipoprotein LipL31 [Leptospira wolffii]TGL49971.1 lipoprotein LipL31 [Leptospira wolffii]
MKRLFVTLSVLFSLILFAACGDGSPVIESIDGNKITTGSFEAAYDTALDTLSRTQNIEKKNIIKFLTESEDKVPQGFLPLRNEFKKRRFFENYRQMLVIKAAADKAGFSKRNDIKEILKFQEMQLISNMYITEQIESRIKISEQELEAGCRELRTKYKQAETLTIEQCYDAVRAQIKGEKSKAVYQSVLDRIKEGVSIKHNDKFDLEKYLDQDFIFPGVKKEEAAAPAPEAAAPATQTPPPAETK